PGAEGGHRPALFSGYGHGASAEQVNQQDDGYDYRQGEKHCNGERQERRRRCRPPRFPEGVTFCGCPDAMHRG
ncbi:hypothetical protein FZI20_23640, partial [Cronobacter sakazakii]